jgi:hypothetical protein
MLSTIQTIHYEYKRIVEFIEKTSNEVKSGQGSVDKSDKALIWENCKLTAIERVGFLTGGSLRGIQAASKNE